MAKVGRKTKFEAENYISAVLKCKSLNDKDVAESLGVDLTTVYRFRLKYPDVFYEASKQLENVPIVRFDAKKVNFEAFLKIQSVEHFIDDMRNQRRLTEKTINSNVNTLFRICTHFGTHPDKLTVNQCKELVTKMKGLTYDDDKKAPFGFSYYTLRKPIRTWFMFEKGISGDYLTSMGIDAGKSKGSGSMASEKIPYEVRERITYESVYNIVKEYASKKPDEFKDYNIVDVAWEMLGLAWFMYYTATRINASIDAVFNDPLNSYVENMIRIHVVDKGREGGIDWKKRLIDDGKYRFMYYVENRFKIPINEQLQTLPNYNSQIFPWANKNYKIETRLMRKILEKAGYKPHQPNHIYRHTHAQDSLSATDYNYELCAEIGGWKSTETMKRHYGKISEDALDRGLRKMMGLPVEDVTYQLRWIPLKCIYDNNKICFDPHNHNSIICEKCKGIKKEKRDNKQ